jgi:hypothetical protein
MTTSGEAEVPPQWKPQELYDFRHGADGPRGYKVGVNKFGNIGSKRKLDEYSEQVRTLRNCESSCIASLQIHFSLT